jgi:hypothetical protein
VPNLLGRRLKLTPFLRGIALPFGLQFEALSKNRASGGCLVVSSHCSECSALLWCGVARSCVFVCSAFALSTTFDASAALIL